MQRDGKPGSNRNQNASARTIAQLEVIVIAVAFQLRAHILIQAPSGDPMQVAQQKAAWMVYLVQSAVRSSGEAFSRRLGYMYDVRTYGNAITRCPCAWQYITTGRPRK
jgi:hypothetical protein